jgi:hypothetical protein
MDIDRASAAWANSCAAIGRATSGTPSGQRWRPHLVFGTENEPPPHSQQNFLANWWFTGNAGKVKQSTSLPVISFGTADVMLTSRNSLLGNLIGGNIDSNFPILSVRGVYPAATMTVTISRAGGG